MSRAISEITRADLLDWFIAAEVRWWGRLDEHTFLGRLYDLDSLPSTDSRFKDASGDIRQHRVNNDDWDDYWVFEDPRLGLIGADDEELLRFLCETVHPAVRRRPDEAYGLVKHYNEYLERDGWQLYEDRKLSGKPVFSHRSVLANGLPASRAVKSVMTQPDGSYVAQQIGRMELAIDTDPELAIGTAKELIETVCKTILDHRGGHPAQKNPPVTHLVKATCDALNLTPGDVPASAKAEATIKKLLGNLGAITEYLNELRNDYGTGHGRAAGAPRLQARHARLAAGASATLASYLIETHEARK